jgi:DNA polymerase
VIVCLGATAAQAVLGKQHRLLQERGRFFDCPAAKAVTATVHPSAILRSPDSETRHRDYAFFVRDLVAVRERLEKARAA